MIDIVPVFVADAHLQLALGHPECALERLEAVLQRLHHMGSRSYLAEAHWLQGRARFALEEITQAREDLQEAKAAAEVTSERPILWQILASLADVEAACGDATTADKLLEQAREVIHYIAEHARELRKTFLAQPEIQVVLTPPSI